MDTSASLTVIRNSVFKGNHTGAGLGGAIWTGSAETKIIGSKIVSNNAEAGGGGIYLYSGNMILKSSVVAHNSTGSDKGGGIAVHGNLSVFSSSISENSAAGNGGGIYADIYTNVLVKASVLNKNISTSGRGAGISTAGTLAIYGSRMAGNEAMYDGGAIYSDMNTSMVVKSCTFSGNRTTNANGGGIANFGNLEVLSSVFTQNSAPGGIHAGGAIMSEFGATGGVSILDSVFRSNYAGSQGGAVCFFNAETNFISGSRIVLNSVLGEGGGLRLINGTTTVTDTVISGNHADHAGGVSIIEAGGTNISRFINCVISGNSANVGGGGMAEGATTNPILQNTVVSGNTAPTNPDLDGTFTIL